MFIPEKIRMKSIKFPSLQALHHYVARYCSILQGDDDTISSLLPMHLSMHFLKEIIHFLSFDCQLYDNDSTLHYIQPYFSYLSALLDGITDILLSKFSIL